MGFYENRGNVPDTDVIKYMAQGVRSRDEKRAGLRPTKREFGGKKSILQKATQFVGKIFKRRKV